MQNAAPDLWDSITGYDALNAAWARVDANEGSAGGDGVTRHEFRSDLFARLNQLRADLLSGEYVPRPYRKVSVPKKKPGYRILAIPSIRDRVVHTSIATALVPILEPHFEECSFAYRLNRGVTKAVARIEQWRSRGYEFVIEADIVRYFDNIDHDILMGKLKDLIAGIPGAGPVLSLTERLLAHQGKGLGTEGVGLVQGSPLSPLLSNLYLDALDEEIEESGVKLVRFADDFVILCKSQRRAEKALAHCVEILSHHRLRLHEEGTRIVNFDKGFNFIGYLFLKSLAVQEKSEPKPAGQSKPVKSEVTDDGVILLEEKGSRFDQGNRVLYVLDPEHSLGTRNRSFSVRREDGAELIAIGQHRVGRIEVGPDVGFDHGAVLLAMDSGTPLAAVDGYGQTRGTVEPRLSRKGGLHLAQAKAVLTEDFRLFIARSLVESRIRNQRTQLSRLNRRQVLEPVDVALQAMKRELGKLETVGNVEAAMGHEGASSVQYWRAIGLLAGAEAPFKRERPARSPLNAAINYLTGILERDIRAAVQGAGLHPGFAFLHGSRDRHDGLVFDMMEPFRAATTEGLAVFLFNARRLSSDMFCETEVGRTELSTKAREILIQGYESAVAKRVNRPDHKGKVGWRALMLLQCRLLVRSIRRESPSEFLPYLMEA